MGLNVEIHTKLTVFSIVHRTSPGVAIENGATENQSLPCLNFQATPMHLEVGTIDILNLGYASLKQNIFEQIFTLNTPITLVIKLPQNSGEDPSSKGSCLNKG